MLYLLLKYTGPRRIIKLLLSTDLTLTCTHLFSKIVVGFNFGKFGVIVRLSLEIGINVKCQEEVARHSL